MQGGSPDAERYREQLGMLRECGIQNVSAYTVTVREWLFTMAGTFPWLCSPNIIDDTACSCPGRLYIELLCGTRTTRHTGKQGNTPEHAPSAPASPILPCDDLAPALSCPVAAPQASASFI